MTRIYKKYKNWILVFVVISLLSFGIGKSSTSKEVPQVHTEETKPEQEIKAKNASLPDIQPILNDYEAFLEKRFLETSAVGAAVAIVYRGKVVLVKPFGIRDINTGVKIDENTVFRLASVSKGFAGILASMLSNDSVIDINDKIKDYIPGFKLKNEVNTNELSIAHTLSHTTGLVPHAFDDLIEEAKPVSQILSELNKVNLAGPPGKYYGYQNVAYSLIDTVLRVKTGKTYAALLKEKIFDPLEMNTASACFEAYKFNYNVAAPHKNYGKRNVRLTDNDRYYDLAPAAGVNASITDMSKWLLALTGHCPDVVDPCSIEMISQRMIRTPLKWSTMSYWKGAKKKYYGLGWRIIDYKGRDVVYHGGFVNGYKTEVAFSIKDDIGIAFLMNSPNAMAAEALPAFLSSYFDFVDQQ